MYEELLISIAFLGTTQPLGVGFGEKCASLTAGRFERAKVFDPSL